MNVYVLKVSDEMLTPPGADRVDFGEWVDMRGFVVVAQSEAEARAVAAAHTDGSGPWWLDDKLTSCEQIDLSTPARVVMANEPTG
jgi:hypothetical protein